MGFGVCGLRFAVCGLGLRVWGLRFVVEGFEESPHFRLRALGLLRVLTLLAPFLRLSVSGNLGFTRLLSGSRI